VRRYFKILKKEPVSKDALEVQEEAMVDAGLRQIKSGEVLSHEEARKKIDDYLRSKRIGI
jgi:predicted transcriptional regulator